MLNAHMASMEKMTDYTDLANSLGNGLITASLQRRQQLLLLRQYYCNDYLHFVAVVFAASASSLSLSLSLSRSLQHSFFSAAVAVGLRRQRRRRGRRGRRSSPPLCCLPLSLPRGGFPPPSTVKCIFLPQRLRESHLLNPPKFHANYGGGKKSLPSIQGVLRHDVAQEMERN